MANERILFMKVLVISDIHANIRALDTILREEADYAAQGILRTTGSHLGRSWSGFASWKIQSSYMETMIAMS